MSFPKYPDYKPSRLDTKAPLPSSWPEAPIKRAFDIVSGSTPKTDNEEFWDGEMTWVTPADLSGLDAVDVTESKRTITEAGLLSCGTTLVPAGSIVISTRAPIGTLAIAGKELCTNQGCKTLVPNGECSSRFAYYYLSACTEQLNIKGRGTTFLELSGDELGSFLMPKPAPVEQDLICAFLDRETAKIDALIAEQQRLIELLQEKRQAVISHAVTKGLNPDAPMKDSGVEWLGEVPEHWTICPLRHFCRITTGFAFKSEEFQDEGIPLVRISDIQSDGTIDLKDAKYLNESELIDHPRETLKHGDIAMAMTGGTIGKAGIYSSDEPALLNQRVCVFRAKADCSQAFLWLITASRFYQEHIRLSSFGGAQPNISDGGLLACICPMPPLAEQEEISAFIDGQTVRLGELQCKAESTIELLYERRSALISAAVTGQIDVRGLMEGEGGKQ